ncbi:Thioredoxin [Bhargavaea ginsengi]|uniref:Thioredoxin n=1 Tax=Bhargavaea ginsengi TaxID=426757 RepID=A0A1H7C0D3_9BACL|nr:thioredoxin family protein [Bhargavaea ginsengi]MCM3087726.1 thioredoxin family protein [Bhargavaea ginsengi]SEJ83098.1 Thioredoxin [Bhargavaea ginsengi]
MEEWNLQQFEEASKSPATAAFYLYTPLCGTCQVASRMMEVVEKLLPEVKLGKADLNYHEEVAAKYVVESVPCLLVAKEGREVEKIYAFQSVPYLYEKLS